MKAAKASKDEFMPFVLEMNAAKANYKELTGDERFDTIASVLTSSRRGLPCPCRIRQQQQEEQKEEES